MNATESAATADAIEQAQAPEAKQSDPNPAVQPSVLAILKSHPAYQYLKWVLQARTIDATRYFMTGVNIESDGNCCRYISTDGRRLHMVENVPVLAAGNYTAIVGAGAITLQPLDAQFPKWRSILPKGKPRATVELDATESHYQPKGLVMGRIAVQIGLLINVIEPPESEGDKPKPGCYVNVDYLKPLIGESWTLKVRKNSGALIFTRGEQLKYTALIMPAQLPE
jgi:hypothetical protein